MPSNARGPRYVPGLDFPFCRARQGAGHADVHTLQGCGEKMPSSEDATWAVLPRPFLSPSAAPALNPPPPPKCDRGGQRAEPSRAKPSGRRHLIPSRRGERETSTWRAGPPDPQRISGQGVGGSSDHCQPRAAEPALREYCSGRLGPGSGWTGRDGARGTGGRVSWGPSAWRA